MTLGYFTGGTVSVSNGSTAVTGTGTTFTQVGVGATFEANGHQVTIASVESDTALTLALAWPGTALSDAAGYLLKPVPSSASLALQNALKLQQILAALDLKGDLSFVNSVPLDSTGEDGDAVIVRSNGDIYEKVEDEWVQRLTGFIASPDVSDLTVLTQAAYEALDPKDANTFYVTTAA